MDNTANDPERSIFDRLQELKADTDLDFMKDFLESAPKQMEEDFVNLSNAVREQNDNERKFYAHKLKGLLLTIGADAAATICSRIEMNTNTGATAEIQELFASLEISMDQLRRALNRVAPKLLDS